MGQPFHNNNGNNMPPLGNLPVTGRQFDPRYVNDHINSFSISASYDNNGPWIFKPDGTKMYNISASATHNEIIQEYDLTKAWDQTTASLTNTKDVSVGTIGANGVTLSWGCAISDVGTSFYTCDYNGTTPRVQQWTLSSAWDISTLSTTPAYSHTLTGGSTPEHTGIYYDKTGTYFFLSETETADIVRLKMNTPWDLSTVTQVNYSTVVSPSPNICAPLWSDNGVLVWINNGGSSWHFYSCGTPWDFSTASLIEATANAGIRNVSSYDGGLTYFDNGNLGYRCYKSVAIPYQP